MKTRLSFSLVLCATACLFSTSAHAAIIDLGTFGGHQYLYDTGSFLSFSAANLAGQAQGGQLVSITSAAESNFLIAAITPIASSQLRTAWIGLTRPSSADAFSWTTGESLTFTNWRLAGQGLSFGEPTNTSGETAGVFYVNDPAVNVSGIPVGTWADTFPSGGEPFNAIYEVAPITGAAPEPTTLLFLALGGALALTHRQRGRHSPKS
jgi:Lectin C-type domain